MKKMLFFLVLVFTAGHAWPQQKLHDGIYLVAQVTINPHEDLPDSRAIVPYSPAFVNEDPENYNPLVVMTDHFFSFDMAGQPIIQHDKKENSLLLLQLTNNAREKLKDFTSSNIMKQIVVVINNEALVLYKITAPVTGGLIKIARCSGQSCKQLVKTLESAGRNRRL